MSNKKTKNRQQALKTESKVSRHLKARNEKQQQLIDSILANDITFAIGPAGTGKTCVSVGCAVQNLFSKNVDKIVISRPLIGAGEEPGALPGGISDKLYPFLIPLYDELEQFVSKPEIESWLIHGILEIVPMAYARGRTFKNTFVILDEAQNATAEQIKMFLTRLGEGSKMVINGDHTQSDLKPHIRGGLESHCKKLENLDGLGIIILDKTDIVRHPLVAKIIERLEY